MILLLVLVTKKKGSLNNKRKRMKSQERYIAMFQILYSWIQFLILCFPYIYGRNFV